jgi:hypothetical protein
MNEELLNSNPEQPGDNIGEEVIWDEDPNPGLRRRIVRRVTTRAGNDFVELEGVGHLVRTNQIHPSEDEVSGPEEQFGDPVMWHRPGEEPIEVREVGERGREDEKEILIQIESGFEWVPAEQIRRLGAEAVDQVVENPDEPQKNKHEEVKKAEDVPPEEPAKAGEKGSPKTDPEKRKPEFKYQNGETVKVRTRDGKKVYDWIVKNSITDKEGKAFVILTHPKDKDRYPDRRVPQDQLEIENPRPSKQESRSDNEPVEDKTGYSDNADNGDDGNNNSPEVAHGFDGNTWVDPRRIQELKDKYRDMLENEKYQRERVFVTKDQQGRNRAFMSDITPMSDYYKDIIKTHLIESEIRNAIELASNIGRTLEAPSEEVKRKMAEMIEMSDQELKELAEKAENQNIKDKIKFKEGDIVEHRGEQWEISGINSDHPLGSRITLVKLGTNIATVVFEKDLRAEQGAGSVTDDQEKEDLAKLKPYFNQEVKVKLSSGEVINGRVGYSTTKNKAIISGPDGKWLKNNAEVDEFLNWQNLNTTAEELAPYLGTTIRTIGAGGEVVTGRIEYIRDSHEVRFVSDQNDELVIEADKFINMQKRVSAKLERIDREVPQDERKFALGQKIKKLRGVQLPEELVVDDFWKDGNDILVRLINGSHVLEMEQDLLLELSADNYQDSATAQQNNANTPLDPTSPPDDPTTPNNPNTPVTTDSFTLPEPLDIKMGKNKKDLKDKLTWYEQIKKQYNKLDRFNKTGDEYKFYEKGGNYYKFMVGFLGVVAMSNLVGLTAGAAIGIQHKRHYSRIRAAQEKEAKVKEEEKKARERQELTDLPKEHVATM